MARLVLDVSNNRPITGRDFKASGSVALIAKATEGSTYEDKTLRTHRTIAGVAGKPFGSYLFLHPDSKGSEAGFYLDYARPRKGDIQPIIDAEVTNLGATELAKRVQRCARALEAEGYKPILYASSSIWKELVSRNPALKRLRVWEAQYPGRFSRWFPRLAKLRVRLGSGVSVVLWQFTDAYNVNGKLYDASVLLTDIDRLLI
jgi:GH25 family lysozyme M1 (1,4-beta-N-acetylmuramidase)